MAERQPKEGSYVHIELMSNDPTRTKAFFNEVFGWKFQDVPEMNYATYEAPTPPHGGLMTPPENMTAGTLNYILATDIDDACGRIQAAGGEILQPKREITNVGWWALFREPGGTIHAVFQNAMPAPAPRPARRRTAARKSSARKSGARRSLKGRRRR